MTRVVTFGELMLRLSPPGHERLLQTPSLVATFGGGEANVAVSLSQFGVDSRYVTRLPANPLGDAAVRALRAEGVDTSAIVRGGDRMGIYFAETGASQRASTVLYDRAHSAISELAPEDIDWGARLDGAAWLHVTGITPALGARGAASTQAAIDAARTAGARVSVDLNFRRKLWTEAQAQAVMRPLVRGIDLVIANEEDLQASLGIRVPEAHVTQASLELEGYHHAAREVTDTLAVKAVAITLRESRSASENGWSAAYFDAATAEFLVGQQYDVHLVDRIGGGDAFAAGLIYGLVTGRPAAAALRFAIAASALKQTIPGDFNRVSVDEVDRLASGDASGRVQR